MPRRWQVLPLAGGALFLLCLWAFFEIAEDHPEGRYRAFDEFILRSFRSSENLALPIGPTWLQGVMRDVSALGSGLILTTAVLGLVGYLLLQGRRRNALAIVLSSAGGVLLLGGIKAWVARPRPDIVPHLVQVTSSSFPSGHSMSSAIIYLSLGAMLARGSAGKGTAIYVLAFAACLTFAVGCSRVYLGVHFPSDVLAGWIAGLAWTLLCFAGYETLVRRGQNEKPPTR